MSNQSLATSNGSPASQRGYRKWATRDGARNWSKITKNLENRASETRLRLANSPECRDYFCDADVVHRDRTGWLGRQDSNLGMAESKSAALPLGYAPTRRRAARRRGRTIATQPVWINHARSARPRQAHRTTETASAASWPGISAA
jgi:hypothetical protein